jgi:hypothetical protein
MPPFAHGNDEFYDSIAKRRINNKVVTPVNPKIDPTTTIKHFSKMNCNEEIIMNIISTENMVLGLIILTVVQILMIGIAIKLTTKTSDW